MVFQWLSLHNHIPTAQQLLHITYTSIPEAIHCEVCVNFYYLFITNLESFSYVKSILQCLKYSQPRVEHYSSNWRNYALIIKCCTI
jgi:hypothetical protein